MTELWLQLIWKINNILYFDKLNSFMPASLLSRRQIIFRPNWQIQSKPITFILPRVIKEQILPGNTQSNSSSLFQSFTISSFLSRASSAILHASFSSFFLFVFFLVCNKKNRKDGSSAAVAEDCEGVWFFHCHLSVASGIWCLHVSLYCLRCWWQMMWTILWNISGFLNFQLGSCCCSPGWGTLCEMPHSLYSLISFVWVANWFNYQLLCIVFSELIRNLGVNAISNWDSHRTGSF